MGNNKRLVILSLSVIFLAVFLALFTVFWKPMNKKAVTVAPISSDVHILVLQRAGGLNVYLSGKDTPLVSVFETTLDYNTKDVEIKSASPGGFFVQPLVLASDVKSGQFSFAFNPGLNVSRSEGILTSLPVLRIEFKAKNSIKQPVISLNPDVTQVYLFNKGAFSPSISLFRE